MRKETTHAHRAITQIVNLSYREEATHAQGLCLSCRAEATQALGVFPWRSRDTTHEKGDPSCTPLLCPKCPCVVQS